MRLSIRWQLMGIVSTVIVVVFIGFLAISKMALVDNFEERVADNDALLVDVLSRSITKTLQASDEVAGGLSAYPKLWSLPHMEQQAMLQSVIRHNPAYELLALVDMDGQQIARSSGVNADRSDREWFRQFKEKNSAASLSKVYFSATTGNIIVTLTEGVFVDGAPVGMVMADISTEEIQQVVEKYSSAEDCQMYLLDDKGNAVLGIENEKDGGIHNYYDMTCIRTTEDPIVGSAMIKVHKEKFTLDDEMLSLIRRALNDESGSELVSFADGSRYFTTHKDIEIPSLGVSWHLLMLRDYNQAMMPVQNTISRTWMLGILGLVLALVGAWYFSWWLNRRLMNMKEVVEEIAEGNYSVMADVDAKDELGVLSRNINAMIEKLRRQRQKEQADVERMRDKANHDVLTGLSNRDYFIEYIRHILHRARKKNYHGALLFVDVDYFKKVNDTYGHAAGDEVLIEVGQRLKSVAGRAELVCRYGGDEFLVFLPGANEQELHKRAEAIVNFLKMPIAFEDYTISLSGSVGVAFYLKDASNADELIRKADVALYRAKANGRGCYACYDCTDEHDE